MNTGWTGACTAVRGPVLPAFSRGSARHVSGAAATPRVLEVCHGALRGCLGSPGHWRCLRCPEARRYARRAIVFLAAHASPDPRAWHRAPCLPGRMGWRALTCPGALSQVSPWALRRPPKPPLLARAPCVLARAGNRARTAPPGWTPTGGPARQGLLDVFGARRTPRPALRPENALAAPVAHGARKAPGHARRQGIAGCPALFSDSAPSRRKAKGPRVEAFVLCEAAWCGCRAGGQAPAPGVFFQSARKASSPLSVSGWLASFSRTLKGMVATSAPSSALCRMCIGLRTLATRVWVENP